jgi:hypothetical protein
VTPHVVSPSGHPEITLRVATTKDEQRVRIVIVKEFLGSGWKIVDNQSDRSIVFFKGNAVYENHTRVNIVTVNGLCHIVVVTDIRRRDVLFVNWIGASKFYNRAIEYQEILPIVDRIRLDF